MKRFFCLFLTLVLLVGMLPVPARATEDNAQVTNEDVTIEGTNGFGNLLSDNIRQQYERETEHSEAYSVTDLTIAGNTAVVEYGAMEEAILVVAIYSEDGLQMITSGKTTVSPDATEATVIISNMPQYFMAAAFLVDTYDYSPLCESYETPMYTREMQELLASTIHDYDADRVLNLDEDAQTNFAVYAEDTIVVEEQTGVNTIISADDATMTYVIGNADDTFLYLQPGDVVAYEYGEEDFLFCKVAAVDVDGTTVTIQGEDLELEDVFSHVKLEGTGSMADAAVDDSACEEGVSYGGMIDGGTTYGSRRAIGGSDTMGTSQVVTIYKELENKKHSKVTVSGSLTYALEVTMDFYVSKARQFIDFKTEVSAEAAVKLTGELEWKTPLPEFAIPVLPGVTVGFEPKLVLKITGEAQLSAKLSFITGFTYTKEEGITPLQSAGSLELKAELKVNVFIGIDLCPNASVLNDVLCEFTATLPYGFLFELKEDISKEYGGISPPQQHACKVCVNFDVYGVFSAGIEVQFLNLKWLKFERTLLEIKRGIGAFYYSVDHAKFGWGECPYLEYLVTIRTLDTKRKPVPNVQITVNGEDVGKTSGNGVLDTYLQPGENELKAVREDGDSISGILKVKEACSTKLVFQAIEEEKPGEGEGDGSTEPSEPTESTEPTEPEETVPGVFGTVNSTTITRPVGLPLVGICGPSATFALYESSGLMIISGTGVVDKDFIYYYNSVGQEVLGRWPYGITTVQVNDGITGIADSAFMYHYGLESITLPKTLTAIGEYAFYGCFDLKTVKIRGALTSIGEHAFAYNEKLTNVYLGDGTTQTGEWMFGYCPELTTVRIPESVTGIGKGTFYECKKLKNVKLPDGLIKIDEMAFEKCESFTSVILPSSLKEIGSWTFQGCTGLKKLSIPEGVTTIDAMAFRGCTSLTEVKLPNSIVSLGEDLFGECCSLKKVVFPDHITSVGNSMFRDCDSLTDLDVIDGMTAIGDHAFSQCDGLTDLVIPESVTQLGLNAFGNCENLRSVRIPEGVTAIPDNLFSHCTNLTHVQIPESVTEIGGVAFYNCTSLKEIRIPDSVEYMSGMVFANCTSLEKVTLPANLEFINGALFEGCTSLREIEIPESVEVVVNTAFKDTALETIDLPSGVEIWEEAFLTDTLKEVWCLGDMPICQVTAFSAADCVGFYPAENETWTYDNLKEQTGLHFKEWHPYTIDENGERVVNWEETLEGLEEGWTAKTPAADSVIPVEETLPEVTLPEIIVPEPSEIPEPTMETVVETTSATIPETETAVVAETVAETEAATAVVTEVEEKSFLDALLGSFVVQASAEEVSVPSVNGVFGGEYEWEETETYTLRTATFHDLVPGAQYVLLDMISVAGKDPLSASNLLSIHQGTANSSGTLVFEYVQRQDHDASYIVACGPSNQNLKEAFIIFPDLESDGQLQAVNPTVDYYGDILQEGRDYVLLGQVSFSERGEYTCFIRGINQYTGLVECTYTVGGFIWGDFNSDETLDEQDAVYLIWHTLFPEMYPITIDGDINRDGITNDTDVVDLLWAILFP